MRIEPASRPVAKRIVRCPHDLVEFPRRTRTFPAGSSMTLISGEPFFLSQPRTESPSSSFGVAGAAATRRTSAGGKTVFRSDFARLVSMVSPFSRVAARERCAFAASRHASKSHSFSSAHTKSVSSRTTVRCSSDKCTSAPAARCCLVLTMRFKEFKARIVLRTSARTALALRHLDPGLSRKGCTPGPCVARRDRPGRPPLPMLLTIFFG